jgi:hypothetical protein
MCCRRLASVETTGGGLEVEADRLGGDPLALMFEDFDAAIAVVRFVDRIYDRPRKQG